MIILVSYLFGKQHGINKCLLFIFSRAVLCLKLIPYPYFQTLYKLIPNILRKQDPWNKDLTPLSYIHPKSALTYSASLLYLQVEKQLP